MPKTTPEQNKAMVLELMDTLFHKRDLEAAARFFSPNYIQRSTAVPAGKSGILDFVRGCPDTLRYEYQTVIAEGDLVFLHGRFSGIAPTKVIAADIIRIEDGLLSEHWDVLQEEVKAEGTKSGLPMYGDTFPS